MGFLVGGGVDDQSSEAISACRGGVPLEEEEEEELTRSGVEVEEEARRGLAAQASHRR